MPRNTVTRECHVVLYMAITHRILQCNCNLQPQPPLSSSFPCSWRFFSSPPPSSSTLSISPSFLLNNLSLHLYLLLPFFLSAPKLTTKHQKQRQNSVFERTINSVQTNQSIIYFHWVVFSLLNF